MTKEEQDDKEFWEWKQKTWSPLIFPWNWLTKRQIKLMKMCWLASRRPLREQIKADPYIESDDEFIKECAIDERKQGPIVGEY